MFLFPVSREKNGRGTIFIFSPLLLRYKEDVEVRVLMLSTCIIGYKPGGRGFDSRWCHWNFSLT
jgi:hypothetical protein